jgi:hypothetical protein
VFVCSDPAAAREEVEATDVKALLLRLAGHVGVAARDIDGP